MDAPQGSIHNPLGYYDDADGDIQGPSSGYQDGFNDDASSMGGPMSPSAMQSSRRPSTTGNPMRSGPSGRRASAMAGRPTSDAAAAFMARKKRHSMTR